MARPVWAPPQGAPRLDDALQATRVLVASTLPLWSLSGCTEKCPPSERRQMGWARVLGSSRGPRCSVVFHQSALERGATSVLILTSLLLWVFNQGQQ